MLPVSDLASVACLRAIAAAGLEPGEVEIIIVATCSPDTVIPSTAAHVQKKMGACNAAVFDLNAGCSGFIYSLSVATVMIRAGGAPELDPDELAWAHVKSRLGRATVRTKDQLKSMALGILRRLQKLPHIVTGFFKAPTCAYAS